MPDELQDSAQQKPQKDSIENLEQYVLHGRGAIIQKLRQLEKGKNLITAHFGGGKYSMLTLVVDILPDRDLLVLDYGSNEKMNQKLLAAKRIVFKTQHDGITAQFTITEMKRAKLQGKTAFACPIPENILWVQRREYYRVRVPLGDVATCDLILPDEEIVQLKVLDISIGGFCLECLDDITQIEPDQTYHNCKLVLSATGESIVSLTVHNILPLKHDDPNAGSRIGCSFVDLSMDTSMLIQRYIQHIDAMKRRIDE